MKKSWICLLGLLVQLLLVGCGDIAPTSEVSLVDSLNSRAYTYYYRNLDSVYQISKQAYVHAHYYHAGKAEAVNHLAFYAFMRMDFEEAERLFSKVADLTPNELERLIADIGRMKIYQRIARNKLYYDYRNSALRRMRRIQEDITVFADRHEKQRLQFAFSEFQIVSATYSYYLQQHSESLAALDSIAVAGTCVDTAQYLYATYLRGSAGLFRDTISENKLLARFDALFLCQQLAKKGGYIYFEANSLQGLSELLADSLYTAFLTGRRETELGQLPCVQPLDSGFSYRLAFKSLHMFSSYGDPYQTAGTYRTLATWLNRHGHYQKALDTLAVALQYVNRHHSMQYHCSDSAHLLQTYRVGESLCTELEWINSDSVQTVPEWIARIREQLSVAYAGLGMKRQSDYNRNCYLDILYNIRQDKELESRYLALEHEADLLNWIIMAVVCGIVLIIFLFWLLNRYWQQRNQKNVDSLRQTLELCRQIVAPLPAGTADVEDIVQVLQERMKPYFSRMFGVSVMQLCLDTCSQKHVEAPFVASFSLGEVSGNSAGGVLILGSSRRWTKERKALVRLIMPYLVWVIENGQALLLLDDQARQLEKQRYVYEQHVEENKRQNVVKKACVAIVEGIRPFIDRIVNEVEKLRSDRYAGQADIRAEKYQYIHELTERINEYNDILALWIKMKQGSLSLSIENFALADVLEVVAKGHRTFDAKRQVLQVDPSDAVVKADKALTLFMINTLAENARKYTQDGGHIHVYASESTDYVEISVADNGRGISSEDVRCILEEKVYDSKQIGMREGSGDTQLLQNKGFGFGLMNCKGIIEKYRKTNPLFQVCLFGIESSLGKGSRFYFRLPKGVRKVFGWLLIVSVPLSQACTGKTVPETVSSVDSLHVAAEPAIDRLLDEAAFYADLVYENNVFGHYRQAVEFADSAICCLNRHYRIQTGRKKLMSLYGVGTSSEIDWWKEGVYSDYHVILDLRNEAAVAFLALKDWEAYTYNNEAYTTLYKLVGEDTSLETYCSQLQHSTSNKIVGVLLCVLLLLIGLIGYYLLYISRRAANNRHLEQLLDVNRFAFSSALPQKGDADDCRAVTERLVRACMGAVDELLSIDALSLSVYDRAGKKLCRVYRSVMQETDELATWMDRCYVEQQYLQSEDGILQCFPLLVELGEESLCVGVLAWSRHDGRGRESDRLLSELMARYVALVVFGSVVKPAAKYRDIEWAEDELRRASFEDNQLHVQNMVLDNCLSTIKHETIYYPNRIRQIVERLLLHASSRSEETDDINAIYELVSYYRDIHAILSSCASRQLAEVTFRRTAVQVADLIRQVIRYYQRVARKLSDVPQLVVGSVPDSLVVSADRTELKFLFENLLDEALSVGKTGELILSVSEDGNFVRFEFEDTRRQYPQEELNQLFYPNLKRMAFDSSGHLSGTAYLVCKQIVRDHDEFAGRRGCRIVACCGSHGGFCVYFTIPKK